MFIASDSPVSALERAILVDAVLAHIERVEAIRKGAPTSPKVQDELDWTRTPVFYDFGKFTVSVGGVFHEGWQDDQNTKEYNVMFNLGAEPADGVVQDMFYVKHDAAAKTMQFTRVEQNEYMKDHFRFFWEIGYSGSEKMAKAA